MEIDFVRQVKIIFVADTNILYSTKGCDDYCYIFLPTTKTISTFYPTKLAVGSGNELTTNGFGGSRPGTGASIFI